MLAEIGAGWYTKLEMGHNVKMSPGTLMAITRVLRLERTEAEYVFALADVAMPLAATPLDDEAIPAMLEGLIPNIHNAGAVLWDRYMTAVRWNAIGDAMFDLSGHPDPIDRNAIVRLQHDEFLQDYFGPDYQALVRSVIGIFRRAYVMQEPTEFARQVYEIASQYELFKMLWNERQVDEEVLRTESRPFTRNHRSVGSYSVIATNLQVVGRSDYFLRIMGPADVRSAKKFVQLAELGSASPTSPPALLR